MKNKNLSLFTENTSGKIISPDVDKFDQEKINLDPSPDYIFTEINYFQLEDDYIIPDYIVPDIVNIIPEIEYIVPEIEIK